MTEAKRTEPPITPNSIVTLYNHITSKMSDLKALLEVQVMDLKQHTDELRRDAATKMEMGTLEKTIELSANAMEKRLETLNEFRNSLRDQNVTFVTRMEFLSAKEKIEEALRVLGDFRTEMRAKASVLSVWWALAVGLVSMVTAVIGVILDLIAAR